ncbi:hypothetical protein BDV93DRAFT_565195 [Ceratobasidium sp. AG-I]|nr:hypothetical protein BDV93DRAFT_565195 [Ceratobasidium sp. AG-I]
MLGTSSRRRLGELIPLPGVGELESIVKGLINLVNAAGYEKEELESLSRRLNRLTSIVGAGRNCDAVTQLSSQLQNIKTRLEAELTRKSRLRVLKAGDRLRASGMLHRELTELIEETQLRLQIANTHSAVEDRFRILNSYDMLFDDMESPTWVFQPYVLTHEARKMAFERSPIVINYRTGRLGTLHVTYKSFSSQSEPLAAVERAEEELKQLSRTLHPNVASIVGITRGYDGLNGFVVAMDGVPIRGLFERSPPGGVLARCISGYMQAVRYLSESGHRLGRVDWDGAGVMVAPNGHVTALPSRSSNRTELGVHIYKWATDCVIKKMLRIYRQAFRHYDPGHYVWTERIPKFLERLASLGQAHVTELRLMKIAADSGLEPLESTHLWVGTIAPPFTLHVGDFVCAVEAKPNKEVWEVLSEYEGNDPEADIWVYAERSNVSQVEDYLYFHRNPLARLSPRNFWGFYSTSSDPCAPSTGMEDLGWTVKYTLRFETMCIGDDWGRQYQEEVQAGLVAMPGGYPGAYIEELSTDKDE